MLGVLLVFDRVLPELKINLRLTIQHKRKTECRDTVLHDYNVMSIHPGNWYLVHIILTLSGSTQCSDFEYATSISRMSTDR